MALGIFDERFIRKPWGAKNDGQPFVRLKP
jgi:hypothetical protein